MELKKLQSFMILIGVAMMASSCFFSNPRSNGRQRSGSSSIQNSAETLDPGYGRVLTSNPIILTGNRALSSDVDFNTLITSDQQFITTNQYLTDSCTNVTNCLKVKQTDTATDLSISLDRWGFDANSNEFLEVHTFYHLNQIVDRFHSTVDSMYDAAQPATSPSLMGFTTSLPYNMVTNGGHWYGSSTTLLAYSHCDLISNNAQFIPAKFTLCFGELNGLPKVKFAQDPSVVNHEAGHALTQIMMNTRNTVNSSITERSELGLAYYDEAGSINEGLADYWSYVMNSRTHFGEWALGRFLNASRPLSEADSSHAPGIGTTAEGRLHYPKYINYDPFDQSNNYEDVHNGGMIASHYLVALTEDLKSQCSWDQTTAVNNVLWLVQETLGHLGDLSSQGSDHNAAGTVNLSSTHAKEWIRVAHPITYRKFFQTFASKLYTIFGNTSTRCNSTAYPKDNIEKLLDAYGLLLFHTYNEDGNHATTGHSGTHTAITATNRVRSVLLNKDLIIYDPNANASEAFVFDDRQGMKAAIGALKERGWVSNISAQITDDLPYNNGNGRVSPGEIVGLTLNLYNNSNTDMAGVQILANDWDHAKYTSSTKTTGKPCNTFEDKWPATTQGGADSSSENSASPSAGDCYNIDTNNGSSSSLETMTPVCFMEKRETNGTKWVLQSVFHNDELSSLPTTDCLDPNDTNSCFMRAIPGADTAWFSRIKPKSTWAQTITDSNGNAPKHTIHNIMFFEVSPWVPPGTNFLCRFRVRFTNCEDCFHDSSNSNDDYLDYQYSGATPFKIFHVKFMVVD